MKSKEIMLELRKKYYEASWDYAEEMAKDPTVQRIQLEIPSDLAGVNPDDFNGWACDWWSWETIELGGRIWSVSGCAFYGTVEFTISEEEDSED